MPANAREPRTAQKEQSDGDWGWLGSSLLSPCSSLLSDQSRGFIQFHPWKRKTDPCFSASVTNNFLNLKVIEIHLFHFTILCETICIMNCKSFLFVWFCFVLFFAEGGMPGNSLGIFLAAMNWIWGYWNNHENKQHLNTPGIARPMRNGPWMWEV